MTAAERHARASALFHEALDRPRPERAAWLDAACPDGGVRQQVAAMLDAHTEANGLLDRPLLGRLGAGGATDPLLGQTVGPWRVTGLLGRGGMGSVYAAERADETFVQRAALKLVRPGLGADFRARFVRERALLAGLDHPGVARLLDGGVTADGTPYLATELVEGEPLTAYADRHRLRVRDRVGLFLQACDAVAYAHRSLVVHRDLKPAHVLVTEAGDVKLLDFGIAKLIEADGEVTRTGAGPLTPAYAAPEQLLGQPVTTATDVYALGVVLYEVLSGRRPYDLGTLTAAQVERVVCETDPPRPSEAAGDPRLRGDLDAITLKALAKEPGRRYASADALADDLRRHLDGVPVRARPATAGYRVRRFVRRHRLGVGVTTGVVALVALLTAVYALRLGAERDRARQAASEAEAQAERAEAVAGFLEQILRAPNDRWYVEAEAKGPDTPIRAVLDEAAARVEADFADRPDLRADLHHILGDTYMALGLADETRSHHRAALALRESLYAPPDPRLAEALYYASIVEDTAVERVRLLRRAVAMQRERPEGNNFPFMVWEMARLHRLAGQPREAEPMLREALAFVAAQFVPENGTHHYRAAAEFTLTVQLLAAALDREDVGDAERWAARLDSTLRRHPDYAEAPDTRRVRLCAQGRLRWAEGRRPEAERTLRDCLALPPPRGRALAADPYAREAGATLAALLAEAGRPEAAGPYRSLAAAYRAERDSLGRAVRAAISG